MLDADVGSLSPKLSRHRKVILDDAEVLTYKHEYLTTVEILPSE